jgi:hypothetical protein
MFPIFACFAFVLFIVLLVQRYEDALASRCALKVLFIIIMINHVVRSASSAITFQCMLGLFRVSVIHTPAGRPGDL